MSDVIAILALTVVLPLVIIFHYVTKWKTMKGLSPEDEKMLGDIWQATNRMDDRITTLERILDVEAPGWRRRHG